jgi:hypothetical protein
MKRADSYTKADFGVEKVTRLYGWVTLQEYAELEKRPLSHIEAEAERGELGKIAIHPESGASVVVWPKDKQGSTVVEGLEIGMSRWSVNVRGPGEFSLAIDTDDLASTTRAQKYLVHMGRDLGEPSEVYDEARELLYRSSFLNVWSAFESFVRDTVMELIRRYPYTLAVLPDGKRPTISFALIEASHGFTDVDTLREALVGSEMARFEAGGQSVRV